MYIDANYLRSVGAGKSHHVRRLGDSLSVILIFTWWAMMDDLDSFMCKLPLLGNNVSNETGLS